MTHRQRIFRLLQEAGDEGVHSFDFYAGYMPRFAARIEEMRKDGIRISSEREKQGVRYRLETEGTVDIPYGYCHCGCGEETQLAPQDRTDRGWKRGEPLKYIVGHTQRKSGVPYRIDPETGCWVWQRAITEKGYGKTYPQSKATAAHRYYYEQAHGPIPDDLQLDHLCRNRACVNPDHLEAVTAATNTRRGSIPILDEQAALAVRASRKSNAELAREYGVSKTAIRYVRLGRTWRDLDLEEPTPESAKARSQPERADEVDESQSRPLRRQDAVLFEREKPPKSSQYDPWA